MKRENKGQQEMVGFVLIVVIVVIGMMIFLILSVRDSPSEVDSLEVDNLLDSLMRYTTECAVVFEPEYDSFEDLFKSCYEDDKCRNLDEDACDYLNSSLSRVMEDLIKSESEVESYEIRFFVKGDESDILGISQGNCSSGNKFGSQKTLVSGGTSLTVRMNLCNG